MRARCDDIEVAWFEAGRGDPLVLVHGLGDDHRAWRRTVPDLLLRHRVLMYDLRGHGATRPRAGPDQGADPDRRLGPRPALPAEGGADHRGRDPREPGRDRARGRARDPGRETERARGRHQQVLELSDSLLREWGDEG